MKLLTKTSIYFLVTSLVVFLVGGISIYYLVQKLIREEINDTLNEERISLIWELKNLDHFENFILPKDSSIKISNVVNHTLEPVYGDTLLFSEFDTENLPFAYIKFSASLNNETRIITIFSSLVETDDLIEGIILSLLIVFICTIVAILGLNLFGMSHLWNPFKRILEQIKLFDFRNNQEFKISSSSITEFNELSIELSKMTQKLTQDYLSLKEFSENASHEMQTPLAIIQSKLELLFQKQDINEENLKAVNSAYQAANRLSKLHHELNLLTRIENQEYKDFIEINLKEVLENQIEIFSDIIELKNLELMKSIKNDLTFQGNLYLIETLISNLFNNAIKHNKKNGSIDIQLENDVLTISNDGLPPSLPLHELFERFKKDKPGSDSTGLGLSIIKQICDYHNIELIYNYDKKHTVRLTFKNQN